MADDDFMAGIVAGNLEVRLARSAEDVDAVQALRYRVFYEEMAADPSREMAARGRDFDRFDSYCDHLMVIDHERSAGDNVVGTYRLLRRSVADAHGGFYSSWEYDIDPIVAHPGEILELGRSCVDSAYRNGTTLTLLWRGNAAYVLHYDVPIMFGCASFPGTDPQEHAEPLSYLFHYHLAPPPLRPRARDEHYVNLDLIPKEELDRRAARKAVPPLIKGYLGLSGFIGDGGVIDWQWGSVDVSIVVKTDLVHQRYRDKLT